MQQKRAYWRRLDNAGKLYSATSNKKDTRVFRFYCVLNEQIDEETLQEALNKTLVTYPVFLSVMRKGLFWHYLERSSLRPVVREESKPPCSMMYIKDKKKLLFEVTYYKNRINFEVFHALTDGTGATEFTRELVKNYLYLRHKDEGLEDVQLIQEHVTIQDQESDSFSKYYTRGKVNKEKKPKAFQLKKPRKESGLLQVHETELSVQEVLKRSRELGVSMTVFLTTVYIMAIHKEMSKLQEKSPIAVMIPVNLRKFFPSDSMLNFFNYIEPSYNFSKEPGTFEDILEKVKNFFAEELTVEKVTEHMNDLISLEMHPVLRLAPLQLKNIGIRAGSKIAMQDVTAIFSNMSAVKMPQEYLPYIKKFGVFTNTPKMELCMCSFGDTISLAFTSTFDTVNIQRNFYQILKEQGIKVAPVTPDFPDTKAQIQLEQKIFKFYSFLCLVAVVACLAVKFTFHLSRYWTFFPAAGIASMWVATFIAFSKRHNLLKNAMWQLVIVSLGGVLWDVCTGWRGWSVDYVIPSLTLLILLGMFIISSVRKYTAREYMIYFVMACSFGIIVPLLLLLTRVVKWKLLSHLSIVVCILFLAALVIFKGKEFREEMHKKFHV